MSALSGPGKCMLSLTGVRADLGVGCRAFDVSVQAASGAQTVRVAAKQGVQLASGLTTAASNAVIVTIARNKPQVRNVVPPTPSQAMDASQVALSWTCLCSNHYARLVLRMAMRCFLAADDNHLEHSA